MSLPAPLRTRRAAYPMAIPSRLGAALMLALIWLGALACLFPLVWAIVSSLQPDPSILTDPFGFAAQTLDSYKAVFSQGDLGTGFKNTAVQVAIVLATTLFFCPLAGYGFAKFEFRGKRFLFGLMMLTLFFVPLTQYVPLLLELNDFGWLDTYQGLVTPLLVSSFGIFWMHAVIARVPNELLHAARVDGCGSFSTWWRIVMPVIRPALVSLGVVTFLTTYNDYFWPMLAAPGLPTAQLMLSNLQSALFQGAQGGPHGYGAMLAGITVVFLPTVLVFLALHRFFLRGLAQGSLNG